MLDFLKTWTHIFIGGFIVSLLCLLVLSIYKEGFTKGLDQNSEEIKQLEEKADKGYKRGWSRGWVSGYDAASTLNK